MLRQSHSLLSAAALAVALEGCATHGIAPSRAQLIAGLQHEMITDSSWQRIHAAEGLLDNGESKKIIAVFQPEADTAPAPFRIGVWRVLARATRGTQRVAYVARVREVLQDSSATDRLSAAETLGKLHAATRADRKLVLRWLPTADEETAPFLRWLLVQTSDPAERKNDETALAKLLDSKDPVTRLRTAFALGRLKELSPESTSRLAATLKDEPLDSVARVYLISALLLHEKNSQAAGPLRKQLIHYFDGHPNEQLEAALVLGMTGTKQDVAVLKPLLNNPEADARIGAANGILHLLK